MPGFGRQQAVFGDVMPIAVRGEPEAIKGHLGIESSSQAHNYAWMTEYGGSGDPSNLERDLEKAIDTFREQEKAAYAEAGVEWPF